MKVVFCQESILKVESNEKLGRLGREAGNRWVLVGDRDDRDLFSV